jgi:flagellar hook-associated protein 2
VNATATAHELSFAQSALHTDVVVNDAEGFAKLDLLDGNDLPFLETGDGTLDSLVSAVNNANAGVTASTLRLDDGSFRLRVVSDTTGLESSFALTNTDGSPILGGAAVTAGRDASLAIGADTIHSASNTFAGVVTGLDLTVAAGTPPGTAVGVTTSRDTTTAQTSVQGLVDAANDLLGQIDKLAAYDVASGKSGPLAGDATIRGLRSQLVMAVTQAADGTSLASAGIQTDRYGKITFDATKFASAYAANPQTISNQLGAAGTGPVPGFAARLAAAADKASNSTTGQLTTSIINRQSTAKRMQTDIDGWDIRLASKQAALTHQFTALEVSLNRLKNQSSWLAGQISSMSNNNSS